MSYCTIEDLRNEGVTEEEYEDSKLEKLIQAACEYIDRITGQWFEPREKIIKLDGRGGHNLVLPIFLSEVEYIKADDELITDYILYNRMEDRAYPKIYRELKWPKGKLNIMISGTFGYTDKNGNAPADIKRIAMKLALYYFPSISDYEALSEQNLSGKIISETTDGHSYSLASSSYTDSITGDTEIDNVLKSYKRSGFYMAVV